MALGPRPASIASPGMTGPGRRRSRDRRGAARSLAEAGGHLCRSTGDRYVGEDDLGAVGGRRRRRGRHRGVRRGRGRNRSGVVGRPGSGPVRSRSGAGASRLLGRRRSAASQDRQPAGRTGARHRSRRSRLTAAGDGRRLAADFRRRSGLDSGTARRTGPAARTLSRLVWPAAPAAAHWLRNTAEASRKRKVGHLGAAAERSPTLRIDDQRAVEGPGSAGRRSGRSRSAVIRTFAPPCWPRARIRPPSERIR